MQTMGAAKLKCLSSAFEEMSWTTLSTKSSSPAHFLFFSKYEKCDKIHVKAHSHSQRLLNGRLPESENHEVLDCIAGDPRRAL